MPRKHKKTQQGRNNNKRFSYIYIRVSKGKDIRFSYLHGKTTIKPSSFNVQLNDSQRASLFRSASKLGITEVITKKGKESLEEYCRICNIHTLVA